MVKNVFLVVLWSLFNTVSLGFSLCCRVRALQAALHADMAADDSMAERRGEDDGDGDTDDFRSSFKSASDNRRDLGEDSDDEQNDVKKIIGTMLSSAKGRDEADRLHSATPPIPVDIPSVPPIGLDAKQQDRAPTLNEGPLQATDSSTQVGPLSCS